MSILNQLVKLYYFSASSSEDLEDKPEDSEVYEREYVEHGNCKCCTSFAKSAELEKQRELWWKQRKRKAGAVVSSASADLWDPTIDLEDFQ